MTFNLLIDLVEDLSSDQCAEDVFAYLDHAGHVCDSLNYQQLREHVLHASSILQNTVRQGAVVIILVSDGLHFIETFFACIKCGLIPAAVRAPRHGLDKIGINKLGAIVRSTDASMLIGSTEQLDFITDDEYLSTRVSNGTLDLIDISCLRASTATTTKFSSDHLVPIEPDQIAYLQFTSGSTQEPRAVAITHRNVLANLAYLHHTFAGKSQFRGSSWLPLHHDMGLVGAVFATLFERGFTVLMSPSTFLRDPGLWLSTFARFDLHHAPLPPFALDHCMRKRAYDDPSLDLSSWKHAYIGAEAVHADTLVRFADAFADSKFDPSAFCPSYGLAEVSLLAAGGLNLAKNWQPVLLRDDMLANAVPRIDYHINPHFVDVRIVDPDTLREKPDGTTGEVWLSSSSAAKAYYKLNELSTHTLRARLPDDGREFVRTGDLGCKQDGRLIITGRLKDIVIVRGMNVAAEDLEFTARTAHKALRVDDASCCFANQTNGQEQVIILQEIQRHLDKQQKDEIVIAIDAALVSGYGLRVAEVVLIPANTLKRTANSKLARAQCRLHFGAGKFKMLASLQGVNRLKVDADDDGNVITTLDTQADQDPVVIIGMACRFPGNVNSPEDFWSLLINGEDGIEEIPATRWDKDLFYDPDPAVPGKMNTRFGGFVHGIEDFDPEFFGISDQEAVEIDPQQRMLLETCWRLFENSGQTLDQIGGTDTGVYVGLSTNDYLYMKIKLMDGVSGFNAYTGLGNANSVASNRISYLFDLHGPSITVDTACSSSLTSLHLAAESVRAGECTMAIAGGVNAIVTPGPGITLSQFGMMAPDGRCKVFDERADGYVRAEGCGLVMLKRRSQALRDGDQILATMISSAVAQDGRTPGITLPGKSSQRKLIQKAFARTTVRPAQISYVEAHGTGTCAGDPAELRQLKECYSDPEESAPCYVGSAKANIGHLESAAGIAGVIKALLVLKHTQVPPQIHLQQLNKRIDLQGSRLHIPTSTCSIAHKNSKSPVYAAVSSFGFGGALGHAILKGPAPEGEHVQVSDRPHLIVISAKTELALAKSLVQWDQWLEDHPNVCMSALSRQLATRRTHFKERVAVVADSATQLRSMLQECAKAPSNMEVKRHRLGLCLPVKEKAMRAWGDLCTNDLMNFEMPLIVVHWQ